ncbi:hypothetical protein WAK64_02500 [Bacillus spongiae]|uniref:Aspartyl-phosphate phosphatase Spo0E family protein n=1 Tax=Bacillus spongiae TaxID=2683610 RepID=A0ABU8H9U3_9BACI
MKTEIEQAIRIKSTALDVIEELVKNEYSLNEQQVKESLELMARCVCDLVNVYTNITEDHQSALQGGMIKSKICLNLIQKSQTTK